MKPGSVISVFLLAVVLALVASGCGSTTPAADTTAATGEDTETTAPSTETSAETTEGGTLVFGIPKDPISLDGALVNDGESLRGVGQIMETLVALKPGTTELGPGLAESWESSPDALSWTFQLHDGITFHDGEPFNAEAVCFNFDRWYNFSGPAQSPGASYYWQAVFGGFNETDPDFGAPDESLYESCEVIDDLTVRLNLTRPSSSFLGALSLKAFSIASPKALAEFGADEGQLDEGGAFVPTGTYGTEHPVGTGPFMFESWAPGERLTFVRNENYWGEKPHIESLVFQVIPENVARLQALQTGEIDGYDLVEPQDIPTIEGDSNLQLIPRADLNVGYVGIQPNHPPLDDLAVRQAIAYGLNRDEVVGTFYGGLGELANQWFPQTLFGHAEGVTEYQYDPAKARKILEDAGYDLPVEITFCYPTDVSRPYMPDPRRNFEAFAASLTEAGFRIVPRAAPWTPDYVDMVVTGKCPLFLLGRVPEYADPDNFVGIFFQRPSEQFGNFADEELMSLFDEAESEPDPAKRTALYEEISRLLMELLPGVPYVHATSAAAFANSVTGYETSPLPLTESFASVSIG